MASIIVIGNEKGGSGKTTTAMHLIVTLLRLGCKVATLDLDSRQMSLTRYLKNRETTSKEQNLDLLLPTHKVLSPSTKNSVIDAEIEDREVFTKELAALAGYDFIVIDTPGSNSCMSRIAHSYADMVITPINDSYIDLDLIGQIHVGAQEKIVPGVYSAMLWEQKLQRMGRDKKEIEWVVVRNRLSTLDAKNKKNVEDSLRELSKKFGFKIAPGFGDRVIFKELFLFGLTLHDAKHSNLVRLSTSVIAARQELQLFIYALNFPAINEKLASFAS
jgi:chromosome partitioning protein